MKVTKGLLALSYACAIGCTRDPIPEADTGNTPPDLPGQDNADGDGDGDGDFGCKDDEIECEGECVNPLFDSNNCGACGRTCVQKSDPILEGGCALGECAPMFSPCIPVEDGLHTCDAVCAAQGETCVPAADWPALDCGVVVIGWSENVDLCEGHFAEQGAAFQSLGCSDPLPFGENLCIHPNICTHFVCCCTQTAQEP